MITHSGLFQHLLNRVKPHRDSNRDRGFRERWWLWGRPRPDLRSAIAGIRRMIITVETSKFKPFTFIDSSIVPDHKLYAIASDDALILGVLSSRAHQVWALAAGGRLGVGNDPTWTNTTCFLPFPFPAPSDEQKSRIRTLAEQLDAHRKAQQARHPTLTLTGMYNVLEKLRAGEPLTPKEKTIHDQGLVSILKQIHDDLDAAVFDAYGWPHNLTDAQILDRLVALNQERAEEEKRGLIRWLRPEFQNPTGKPATPRATQATLPIDTDDESQPSKTTPGRKTKAKVPWPTSPADQAQAIRAALASHPTGATAEEIARTFHRAPKKKVAEILTAMTTLGQARALHDHRYAPI